MTLHGTNDGSCHFSCTFQRAVLLATCGTNGKSYHFSCTFQRAVLVTLHGTDDRSCHFVYVSACGINRSVWYRRQVVSLSCAFQRVVIAALRSAERIESSRLLITFHMAI